MQTASSCGLLQVTQHPFYLSLTSALISAEVTELATNYHPSHSALLPRCVGGKSVRSRHGAQGKIIQVL